MREVKKAPVLIVTSAMETLETLIALKKKIQCSAMITPVPKNLSKDLRSIEKPFFLIKIIY